MRGVIAWDGSWTTFLASGEAARPQREGRMNRVESLNPVARLFLALFARLFGPWGSPPFQIPGVQKAGTHQLLISRCAFFYFCRLSFMPF